MGNVKIQGTEFYVNVKHEDLYELSLIISCQVAHSFKFNLAEYIQMINHLRRIDFSQNTDYSLDPKGMSSFYITNWKANGESMYCSRAWINNNFWSQYSIIKEEDVKNLPQNLESLIEDKKIAAKAKFPEMQKSIVPLQKLANTKLEAGFEFPPHLAGAKTLQK
jgi:hypothetical protein